MSNTRFARNEQLLGEEGQRLIRNARVGVVGVGGIGTHVVQQLAYLGVGELVLVEPGHLKLDNRNRYVTAWHADPVPDGRKVDLGCRLIQLIDPGIIVRAVAESFPSAESFEALDGLDAVFGCVDQDAPRLILTEFCATADAPYVDAATDVDSIDPLRFGGRVATMWDGPGCLVCLGELDAADVQRHFAAPETQADVDAIYGVRRAALAESGPSVVSVNGVVASLAVTEFMLALTGLRRPARLLTYHAHTGKVLRRAYEPDDDCYYCSYLRCRGARAGLDRYIAPANKAALADE